MKKFLAGMISIAVIASVSAWAKDVIINKDAFGVMHPFSVGTAAVGEMFMISGGKTADGIAKMLRMDDDGRVLCAKD